MREYEDSREGIRALFELLEQIYWQPLIMILSLLDRGCGIPRTIELITTNRKFIAPFEKTNDKKIYLANPRQAAGLRANLRTNTSPSAACNGSICATLLTLSSLREAALPSLRIIASS